MVVFGIDYVLKQNGAGTSVALNIGIKRKVQGYDLDSGISLTCIVKCIA